MERTSYANGKLLITGEYLVLEGATALAVPTIPGQEMSIVAGREPGILHWQSFYNDSIWFEARYSFPEMKVLETSDQERAGFVQGILKETLRLRDLGTGGPGDIETLRTGDGIKITSRLGFHPDWGLGSSSSLIYNLATLFGIDPFKLFFNTQAGSGYDIACASSNKPLLYRLLEGKPEYKTIDFHPPFTDKMALVYSGRKQSSEESVDKYRASGLHREIEKGSISAITREIINTHDHGEFMVMLNEHEKIISRVLGLPTIKAARFADFPGSIKSLGAWGGDFLLATAPIDFNKIKSYFSRKGLETVFGWAELIG